ncbi:MAG: PocR ligand-binding domain-containing protein [Candidatus Cloacimonetes bacterium]|nr:PocR ligand-binding domain-containing protein [Candidatus Cloacimonadota bacterium]
MISYNFEDIVDIPQLQRLMDKFYHATGTGTAVIGMTGEVLTASGWQDICTKFHRVNEEACRRCVESDTALANSLRSGEKFNIYHCLNGLVDVAMPIYIKGEHKANLFIGQFLSDEPDREFFKQQAAKFGFPETEYLAALDKVSVLSEDEVKSKLEYLTELSALLGESGLRKLEFLEIQEDLEKRVTARTQALKDAQIATLNIMQDVDEARLKTEKLNDDLQKTNKELEMFAYVASHDLQEPLRKIASFTELLEKRYSENLDERGLKYMHYITEGAKRMQQLITDLLQFSRVGTRGRSFTEVDMNKVLRAVQENLALTIQEKKARIEYSDLPVIKADEMQMIQVFQNLIDNAIKFCPQTPLVKITAESRGNNWLFKVSDNGIGIEKEYTEKIFIIFQRLHDREEYKGTGIGLAVCKKIIERHKGRIWFDSEPGKGTVFSFTINKKIKI